MTRTSPRRSLRAIAAVLGVSFVAASANASDIGKLTGQWWQWASPTDAFGAGDSPNCVAGRRGSVWFLAGAFRPSEEEEPLVRNCRQTIPRDKSILFPLINAEVSANDCAGVDCSTVDKKRQLLLDVFDGTGGNLFFGDPTDESTPVTIDCKLEASVDGEAVQSLGIPILRVQSPPFVLPDDRQAVSDGQWVLLPPLPPGRHSIRFGGGLCGADAPMSDPALFLTGVTYEILVR